MQMRFVQFALVFHSFHGKIRNEKSAKIYTIRLKKL